MELESVKKIYDGYSSVYDTIFKRFFHPRIKHAIQTMNFVSGEKVLDVGVGTGLSLTLFPRDCEVTGIDLSSEMLSEAHDKVKRSKLDHVTLLQMNAMNLNFKDNSFDKVFISHVVSVVPDLYKAMSEVRRVCKPGGEVVIVNHFKSTNKMVAGMEKVFNPISKKIGWRTDLCLEEFMEKCGLKIHKMYKLKKIDLWHIIFATNEK